MANLADIKTAHYVEEDDVVITPRGRMSFVALSKKFKSKTSKKADDDGKFAVELNIPPGMNLKALYKMANEAAKDEFGVEVDFGSGKPIKVKVDGKQTTLKSPFLKSDEKLADVTSRGEPVDLEGYTMLRTSAYTRRPKVRDQAGEELDTDDIDTEAYSGRWARIMVRAKGYRNDQFGVTFYLEGVQLLKHDDKIGGGPGAVSGEAFGAVDDEDDEDEV